MKKKTRERLVAELISEGISRVPLPQATIATLNAALAAAYEFFRLPLSVKIQESLPEECGYRPEGIEYSASPERPDQVESFTVSARMSEVRGNLHSSSAYSLFERMMRAFGELEAIAEEITTSAADVLSTGSSTIDLKGAFHLWSRLQINYSRPAATESRLINDPHEDGTVMTIATATGPGLEIQTEPDVFQPFAASAAEAVILPGEIGWLLSGGQIRPMYHRVRPDPQQDERIACLFFADIGPQFCQPWVLNEVNKDVDIGARVLTNVNRFGLAGFTPE